MKHLKDLEAKVLIDKAQLKFLPHTKLRAHITKETVEAIFPHHESELPCLNLVRDLALY